MNWYKHGHRFTKDGGLSVYLDPEDVKNLMLTKDFWDRDLPPGCSMKINGVVQALLRHQANYIKEENKPSFEPSYFSVYPCPDAFDIFNESCQACHLSAICKRGGLDAED